MPTLRLLPELEDAIRHIPGVRAASVVTGPDAVPTEVHVLAAPGKPAKQIVRDVQSLALARYDIVIDHRIVSVVQIGEDEPAAPTTTEAPAPPVPDSLAVSMSTSAAPPRTTALDQSETAPRPAISSIMVRTAGTEAEATVTLAAGGHVFEGKVVGPGSKVLRPRLIAQATLSAVDELLGTAAEVESAAVVGTGSRDVALVVLSVTVPRLGEQVVSGSAVLRGDEADAVARAVLDALNRQLTG